MRRGGSGGPELAMEIDAILLMVVELCELTGSDEPAGSVSSVRLADGEAFPFSSEARLRSSLFAIDLSVCDAEVSDGGLDEGSNGGREIATGVDRGGNGGGTGRGDTCGGKLALGGETSRAMSLSPSA